MAINIVPRQRLASTSVLFNKASAKHVEGFREFLRVSRFCGEMIFLLQYVDASLKKF